MSKELLVCLMGISAILANVGCGDSSGGGSGGASSASGDTSGGHAAATGQTSTSGGPSGPSTTGPGPSTTSGSGPACDASNCTNFCLGAGSCLFPNDTIDHQTCNAKCNEYCGNTFFDDEDAAVIACTEGVNALDCSGAAKCCQDHFTSELCS